MTTLWFLFCDKIIVKVSVLLIKSPASLPLPLSPPSSFFSFFFQVWESENWVALGTAAFVLSGHVHTGISNVRETLNNSIRLRLEGLENNFTEIVNQDLVPRGASSRAEQCCCQG